ncbi:MAG TPA: PQQ-binding-like beta-propeller repeat protein [Ktedonobacterales bacterium]|nr:PQQ-binding-like beta-propeller repeat protein [Ktedonobacterales bacterium]
MDCRPVVDGDAVYVTTNSFVYSFNIRDGTRRWRYALGELTGGTSSPALAHHVIFFGAADGNVYAINA